MDKKELIDAMAKRVCCKKEAKDAFDELLKSIRKGLLAGEKIHLKGIGTIYTKIRKPRMVKSLHSNEMMHIPAKLVVKFKASTIPLDKNTD